MDTLITFAAKYLFLLVALLWAAAWLQASRRHRPEIAWATFIAVVAAAVLDKIAGKLYYDPRPFVSHHIHPLVAHAADNGFPSEHTLFSIALGTVLFLYRPKLGMLALAIALIVGIARVAAYVHSPIDIAGAIAIGAISGYAGYSAASRWITAKKPNAR
jgi:undecaprenyl-diphosphatase